MLQRKIAPTIATRLPPAGWLDCINGLQQSFQRIRGQVGTTLVVQNAS
jgi:hypothetical protein